MTTYLSMSFACAFCDSHAPEHDNGMFKYVVVYSQTGEWSVCCEKCAEKTASLPTNIDHVFKQDVNGLGWEWGKEKPANFVDF